MYKTSNTPFSNNKSFIHLSAAMRRAEQKAKEVLSSENKKQSKSAVPFILPGINETVRAIPNYIARSSIFAPVRRGWRQLHDESIFLNGQNILLKGSGKQLSEDHADIWMHAMYLQSTTTSGKPPTINRAEFLRGIGRRTGGSAYEWLHQGMKDLTRFTLCIEARRKDGSIKYSYGNHPSTRVLAMIGGFDYDEKSRNYTIFSDPRWNQIFSNREYALIDWNKRLQMRHELSKSLQRLIGTSADIVQKYSLDILKERAQYKGRDRDFKASLQRSLAELESIGIITNPQIEAANKGHEQAVWTRLDR